MQGLVAAYGGTVSRLLPAHGEVASISHDGAGVFAGVPQGFAAVRYHSLGAVELPAEVVATAWSEDGMVMGVRHVERPLEAPAPVRRDVNIRSGGEGFIGEPFRLQSGEEVARPKGRGGSEDTRGDMTSGGQQLRSLTGNGGGQAVNVPAAQNDPPAFRPAAARTAHVDADVKGVTVPRVVVGSVRGVAERAGEPQCFIADGVYVVGRRDASRARDCGAITVSGDSDHVRGRRAARGLTGPVCGRRPAGGLTGLVCGRRPAGGLTGARS